ncbi:MAG: TIGR02996 domain-containing protein, partial [Deltaproteobacteria bacterium]|nr:TIGR02996 domain-containing protein [Deltaproteobacteria bacterium]
MMNDAELAELLRSVIARPDDLDALRVYADVLIERGDPRGELIAVQLQRREQDSPELVARERELAAALDATLVGQLDQPGAAFSWQRGFLEAIDFTPTAERRALADTLRQLGTLPLARQLRRIVIRFV